MSDKELFVAIFDKHINRQGKEELLNYLIKSDFFVAPASMKFHSCVDGGLVRHSINVYQRLLKLCRDEFGADYNSVISDESIAICGLLHDLCKVDYYKQEMRNVKIDNVWTSVPYFSVDEKLPYGHGEKSVYIINGFIRLTRDEALAINWHMGGFDARIKGGSYSVGNAYNMSKLSVLTHMADLMATYLDEESK